MRKIFLIAAAVALALYSGCSASSDSNAGAEYVKASQKLMEAESAFMKANYSGALELARSSQSAIDGILKKYPDSSVALRLMSDPNVMVASCPYRDLKTKLIPRLELMADPLMKPVSIAWALAVGKSHTGCSGRIAAFALELAKYRQELGISPEEFQKMEALCVYKIPDYAQKSALISSLEGIKAPAPAPASAKQEQPNLKATLVLAPAAAKINNTEDFLASSRSDASLVSYELRAVDSLKKKAPIAGASGGEVQKAFFKILEEARGNILKISTESMRESALSNIAVAFADAGDVVEAVRIAQSLKNHELFESVFNAIADRAGSGKNYISAMGLAERLKNQKAKDEFLSRMAAGLAKQGLFRESIEISKRIKSVYSRNEALAVAAKCAMAKGKNDIVLSAVSLIDIGDLSFLKTFDSSLPGYPEMTLTKSELKKIEQLPVVVDIRENIDVYPPDYPDSHITLFPYSADFKWTRDNYGPIWIPAKGATVELNVENLPLYRRIIEVYEENTLDVVAGRIIINGQPCSEYTFKQDYYFMMGDNRHHSSDSRYWGFVPEDHIVGTPVMIWFSTDKNKSFPFNIRWKRIFDLV